MYPEKLLDLTMNLIIARPTSISGKWCIIWKDLLPRVIAYEQRAHTDLILLTFSEREAREGLTPKQWAALTEKIAEIWEPEEAKL